MNKQTELALKDLLEVVEHAIEIGDWKVDGRCDPDLAINRAKEALEQPAKNIRDSFNEMLEDKVAYYKGKQPAQGIELEWYQKGWDDSKRENQAQEPVAKGFIRSLVSIDKNGIETWKEEPFYTQPPSWQGLDAVEVSNIFISKEVNGNATQFARAIEQALRSKNESK